MPTEERAYKLYCYTNKINGKKYVGITRRTLKERASGKYTGSQRFANAIKKYGFENFNADVLANGLTKEEACRMEIETIAKLGTTNPDIGYNIAEGGQSPAHTPEVRKKISIARKGCKFTEEHKKKISLAKLGKPSARKNWHPSKDSIASFKKKMIGRKLSEEHKKKISVALKGKGHPWTEEQRRKVCNFLKGRPSSMKGKKMSEEARKKMSEAKKGKLTWNKGKKLSESHIKNLIIGHHPKMAICIQKNIVGTVRELEVKIGIDKNSIYDVLIGRRKTAHGLTFEWR